MAIELMAHFVAGYPTLEGSLKTAEALVRGGADYLEVQFPFSDPSADGPVIQKACAQALDGGFTLARGWDLVSALTGKGGPASKAAAGVSAPESPAPVSEGLGVPVFIMSYGNPVFTFGVAAFAREAAKRGAAGLIVPDLVPGADEGLYEAGRREGLMVVPVAAPSLTEERRRRILEEQPQWIYAALRRGITGAETALDAASEAYLASLREGGARLIAGFGIRRREQMEALEGQAHCAVAGSFFVEGAAQGPQETEGRVRLLASPDKSG